MSEFESYLDLNLTPRNAEDNRLNRDSLQIKTQEPASPHPTPLSCLGHNTVEIAWDRNEDNRGKRIFKQRIKGGGGETNFLLWRDIEKNLSLDINGDVQIGNCGSYTIRQNHKGLTQIAELSPKRSVYNTSKDLKVLITIHLKWYATPREKLTPLSGKKTSSLSASPHDISATVNKYQPVPPLLGSHLCSHTPSDRSDDMKTKSELWGNSARIPGSLKKTCNVASRSWFFSSPISSSLALGKFNFNK